METYDYTDERREAREAREDYHLRNIVLDEELVQRVFDWHSGMYSMMYSLASTGLHDFVSASMLDAAADELSRRGFVRDEDAADHHDLWGTLSDLADYPYGDTADAMGCSTSDSGYATWLMPEVPERSGS